MLKLFFSESDSSSSPSESDSCSSQTERSTVTPAHMHPHLVNKRLSLGFALATRTHHYGSFYLRMGAVGMFTFVDKLPLTYNIKSLLCFVL